jgi:ABC-type transport system substrate-binding protein
VSLREDAVFQDGTPITAADVKAYWEHGAKPENIAGWGAASIALGTIKGWDELKAGDVTDAEGLRVIDDHTLEITQSLPWPAWPQYMAVWMTGLTKLDQVLSDPDWGNNPIGAGPYDLSYNPDSGLTITNRVESVGKVWWGPDSIIDKMVMPAVPDAQVKLIMYENNEIDILQINEVTFNQVLDPSHPWSTHLRRPNYPGIWWWGTKLAQAPMEDLFVRKALAQGMDMETIVQAVVGPAAHMGTGIFGPSASCYNPDSRGHFYDPDLARQYLDESTYGSGANVPVILADLSRGSFINMSVAIKEYWKDNLNIELDVLRRERGMPRRENTQLRRYSEAAWVPDPTQVMTTFTAKDIGVLDPVPGAYEVMDALHDYARSLPLDHPDRCKAYQAVETEWFDKVYGIPFQWFEFLNFVIKPWVGGFETNSNIRVNLWDMYVEKH